MLAKIKALISPGLALLDTIEQVNQKTYQLHREALVQSILQQPRYADDRRLNRHEFKLYSQSGQDGIIEEIFRRIEPSGKTFVEFGVGAGGGFENNTTYLLAKGWNGYWIEADVEVGNRIRKQMGFLIDAGALKLATARVTAENIALLFEQLAIPQEFDLLSIDIDSCDYWVWRELSHYQPRVVVIEYNSFLPASADWVLSYDPDAQWEEMNMEFGASLKALERAGREMGYVLVGCDLTGSDAFFVREDLAGNKFCSPFSAENHYEPMRYYLIHQWGYSRTLSPRFKVVSDG
jgi:hypothetical protein